MHRFNDSILDINYVTKHEACLHISYLYFGTVLVLLCYQEFLLNYTTVEVRKWMSNYTSYLCMQIEYVGIEVTKWMNNYTP